MNESIYTDDIIEMLLQLKTIFRKMGIEYYVVGAAARDMQIAKRSGEESKRTTNDIDLAIMLDSEQTFYKLKETILKNEHFEDTDNTDPIKLIHKGAIELDLLPFGDIEDSSGEVTISQPKTFVINMPGFKELLPHTETIQIGEQELNVCSLEGIIILKLLAYNDRPERTKDLDDINHIISVYFDMNANEIYDEHHAILAIYEDIDGEDYERHVSARIIGRKIAGLLTANYELLKKIKDQIPFGSPPDPIWLALEEGINDIIQ